MKKILYILTLITLTVSCKNEVVEEQPVKDDGLITVTAEQFKSSGMIVGTPSEQDFDVTVKTSPLISIIVSF